MQKKFVDNKIQTMHHLNKKGFTLIEILVALGILGLIVTIIYPTFAISFRITRDSKEKAKIYQFARIAMERMADEISASYIPPPLPAGQSHAPGYKPIFIFQGINEETDGFSSDRLIFAPAIYKWTSPEKKETEFSKIEYLLSVDKTEDNKRLLLRRENYSLDTEHYQGGNILELGESLKSLDFKYLDSLGAEFSEWDSQNISQGNFLLPRAVKITLIFEDEQKQIKTFSTLTEINIKN